MVSYFMISCYHTFILLLSYETFIRFKLSRYANVFEFILNIKKIHAKISI